MYAARASDHTELPTTAFEHGSEARRLHQRRDPGRQLWHLQLGSLAGPVGDRRPTAPVKLILISGTIWADLAVQERLVRKSQPMGKREYLPGGALPEGWDDDAVRYAVSMAQLARQLIAQESVQATMQHIVTSAVGLVQGCEQAGVVMRDRRRRVSTEAATDALVYACDEAQGELGEGPCFDTVLDEQPAYWIADMAAETRRWPRFAPRAHALGVHSMMGLLLYTRNRELGALNLYSTQPKAFTESSVLAGWLLASHAAAAFSAAQTREQLQTALASRTVIGEALGALMERYGIGEDEAFARLTKLSQDRNNKLRDIASEFVNGDLDADF